MIAFIVALFLLAAADFGCLFFIARKVSKMSTPEFDQLTKDVLEAKAELAAKNTQIAALSTENSGLVQQVADLSAQLTAAKAAAGVPVADIAALDAQLAPALDTAVPPVPEAPPVTPAESAPEAPPAA